MSITKPAIKGFVSRSDAGLRRPRSVSRNISPQSGGVALHYGGNNVPVRNHDHCISIWKSWQDYHMNNHGWVDIAYTMGVCQHGYAFAGRGAGIRTAANGSNHGNGTHYAVCWIGGARQTPSSAALAAFAWAINELRNNGNAGNSVKPHSFFSSTACPGGQVRSAAQKVDGKKIGGASNDPWEEAWNNMDEHTRKFLQDMADRAKRDGLDGDSFVHQFVIFHRNGERDTLKEIMGHIKAKGTSVQGFVRGATNLFRHARDNENWPVDTS